MTGSFRSSAIFYNSFRRMSVSSSITSEPVKLLSCICFFAIPWAIAYLAPPSMEFSRQEYWSVFPFPSPGDLLNPGIKPRSPALQVVSLPAEPQGKPKNTAVGSLSLLQWTFPTQESHLSFLHCRQILYQLSYQGSPLLAHVSNSHCSM